MNNILSNIGDEFTFSIHAFINGEMSLNSYVEDVEGETRTRFFERKFKYSFDSVNYSEWEPLTVANISAIRGYADNILFIDFLYIRKGTDSTGELKFNSLSLDGDVILQINTYSITTDSIFSEILKNNFYTQSVRMNLLRKVYNSGILPEFIDRKKGFTQDKDFVSFWTTICGFFALISTLVEEFDSIPFESKKLQNYLEQYNIALHKDSTLEDLQAVSENLLSQLRLRGTVMPTREKEYVSAGVPKSMVSLGEWLRLISYSEADEFLIDFERKKDNGYYLQQSSVIYPGTFRDNKQIEKYKNFYFTELILPNSVNPNDTIKLSKAVDYIFEVEITKPVGIFNLKLGLGTFNASGFRVANCLKESVNDSSSDYFFKGNVDTLKAEGTFFIRCIIFNEEYDGTENNEPSILMGANLIQTNTISNSVIPIISISEEVIINSVSIRPLVKGWGVKRPKNPQFLQSLRFINNYRLNNNNDKDEERVDEFQEKYLIPYHYKLNSIALSYKKPEIYVDPNEPEVPITNDNSIFDNSFDSTFQ